MRVAELQMYRETAFERDGRDSNENAPRVYSQRPPSQAEADVADLYTIIIMSFPRRSRTAQPISYAISSDDEDDKKRVVDLSDQEFENDESNSDDHSSDDEQAQSIAPSSSSPNFGGATGDGQQARHGAGPAHQHPRAPRRRVRPAGELGFLSRSIALFTAAHMAPPAFLFYQSSVVVRSSVDSHHHC